MIDFFLLVTDKLVVVGGSDGCQSLCTTEVFDFETETWSAGPSMTSCRANINVAVIDNKLFAVGGFTGAPRRFLYSLVIESSFFFCLDIIDFFRILVSTYSGQKKSVFRQPNLSKFLFLSQKLSKFSFFRSNFGFHLFRAKKLVYGQKIEFF